MHDFLNSNGKIQTVSEARISAISSAALYGKGVFTTISISNAEPFLWEKHWRRIENDAEKMDIDLTGFSEKATRHSLDELIEFNRLKNGRARITFFDDSPGKIWRSNAPGNTRFFIITAEFRPKTENFKLGVSPFVANTRSPLTGVKSCNYLEKLLTLEEANERGFDEAIVLNERGEVSSAAMANVFWLKNEVLYTPSLKTGCLAGTTREFVLENLECREVEGSVDALYSAEAIFLTSAGLGIVQVAEFESRTMKSIQQAILDLLPNRI